MKNAMIVVIALLITYPKFMYTMQKKLSFVSCVAKDENFEVYKKILRTAYSELVDSKKIIDKTIRTSFNLMSKSAEDNNNHFIKIFDENKLVGYLEFVVLKENKNEISLHILQAPLLPEYHNEYEQCIAYAQKEFPQAQTIFTTCPPNFSKLQQLIKANGFEEDDTYITSKEFFTVYEKAMNEKLPKNIIGYSKKLKQKNLITRISDNEPISSCINMIQ